MPAILNATACPALQVPATPAPSIAGAFAAGSGWTPKTTQRLPQPDSTSVVAPFNANAQHLELLSNFGGGGYAVLEGLTLSAGTGLTLNIAKGYGAIGGLVELAANTTLALPDGTNARRWLWLRQDGTLTYTLTAAPPAATVCVLLGSALVNAGAIASVDTSGVLFRRGGLLWRETADPGVPGDTPPASIAFVARTPGGCFLWDGVGYVPLCGATRRKSKALANADATLTASEYDGEILEFTGALTAARAITLPNHDGRQVAVANKTTGGFALTFKVAAGTGVAVAAGKRALLYCDGTDYVRLSPDA